MNANQLAAASKQQQQFHLANPQLNPLLDHANYANYADYHHYVEEQIYDLHNAMNAGLISGGLDPNDMETDEDAIERKKVLNLIYANDYKGLKDLKVTQKDLNWRERHQKTDLDERITPLSCSAFLGRLRVTELLLENPLIDLDMPTDEHEYTPLSAACMAGNYEIVKLLAENGANVNHRNSQGYTPMLYAFSRMTETSNVYENKNICLKIAEVLLHYGADVNYFHNGKTLLMTFCGISMTLDPVQLEMNLDVIRFLCEHGADRSLKSRAPSSSEGLTVFEMSNFHCASLQVKSLL